MRSASVPHPHPNPMEELRLTVDVEDYFHVAAFARQIDPATWDRFPLRVERNTHRLLELFAEREGGNRHPRHGSHGAR